MIIGTGCKDKYIVVLLLLLLLCLPSLTPAATAGTLPTDKIVGGGGLK